MRRIVLLALLASLPGRTAWSAAPPFEIAVPTPDKGAGGVGAQLEQDGERVRLGSVVPAGPAGRAGLRAGDRVVAVDDWKVAPRTPVEEVTRRIRGDVGTRVRISYDRSGTIAKVEIERRPMAELFPRAGRRVVPVRPDVAIVARSEGNSVGIHVRHVAIGTPATVRYDWALLPRQVGGEAERGSSVSTIGRDGGTLAVGPIVLHLALRQQAGHGPGVFVERANAPLALGTGAAFWSTDPAKMSWVQPKLPAVAADARWPSEGGRIRGLVRFDGAPLGQVRVSLRLVNLAMDDRRREVRDTAPVKTAGDGTFDVSVPGGRYTLLGLAPSGPGDGSDASALGALSDATRERLRAPLEITPAAPATVEVDLVSAMELSLDASKVLTSKPRASAKRYLLECALATPTAAGGHRFARAGQVERDAPRFDAPTLATACALTANGVVRVSVAALDAEGRRVAASEASADEGLLHVEKSPEGWSLALLPPAEAAATAGLVPAAAKGLVGKKLGRISVGRWLANAALLPRDLGRGALLLEWWATWCGPCKQVSGALGEVYRRHARRGLTLVGLAIDEDPADVEERLALEPSAHIIGHTAGSELGKLGLVGIPSLLVIDASGVVRYVRTGGDISVRRLEKVLDEVLR